MRHPLPLVRRPANFPETCAGAGWEGDRGRGDIADLLGRFHKVDPGKVANLQSELHKLTGERIPFRVAPVRAGEAPTATEQATTTVNPWGSAEDVDRWEAGNMAKVLLGRGDYADAVKHFAGESTCNLGRIDPPIWSEPQRGEVADRRPTCRSASIRSTGSNVMAA